jgi:NADH:quinone reductase (non-electrogenic)
MSSGNGHKHVVIVGGGFAGVGCARRLAGEKAVRVTLIDCNNYHQFQPLLYQVATSQLAPSDVAYSLRKLFAHDENVGVKLAEITSIDPITRTVTARDGDSWSADAIVVAAGSQPNFFRTPGAELHTLPLYTLDQATRLRSRIIGLFEDADRSPGLVDRGALNFVIVGAGATGVEVAGALADLVHDTMSAEFGDLAVAATQIHVVDLGHVLLGPFSDSAHDYAARVLQRKGVRTHLGTAVTEVGPDHVTLGDGTTIATHCVIWGGGIRAAELAGSSGLPQGRGGRIDVDETLALAGMPGVYAAGDVANIPTPHGDAHPQLGSVALQSGQAVAENVLADFAGKPRRAFHYHDKGIMAMIGRGAAIAEVGAHRHELHGAIAHSAWLGVHAALMNGVRSRIDAFVSWSGNAFATGRGPQLLDRADAARIDWEEEEVLTPPR